MGSFTAERVRLILDEVDPRLLVGTARVTVDLCAEAPETARRVLDPFAGGSIIVFALPISEIALWTWYSSGNRRYVFANHMLERAADALSRALASAGARNLDLAREAAGHVSLVSLGEWAGLGRRGINNLLLHPEFGSWIQLHAVITDARIAHDGAPVTDPCISCLSCVSACPAEAITTEDFFADACVRYVASFWMPRSRARALSQNAYVECNACIASCPIGRLPSGLDGYEVIDERA
ncbi:MAG: 4Fe-4S double cluster binding domain-containing protein [Salinarimonas sp.]